MTTRGKLGCPRGEDVGGEEDEEGAGDAEEDAEEGEGGVEEEVERATRAQGSRVALDGSLSIQTPFLARPFLRTECALSGVHQIRFVPRVVGKKGSRAPDYSLACTPCGQVPAPFHNEIQRTSQQMFSCSLL